MIEVYWSEFAGRPQVRPGNPMMWAKYGAAIDDYKAGMPARVAASRNGVKMQTLYKAMKTLGVPKRGRGLNQKSPEANSRAIEMAELRKTMTLKAIGERYGITRERVRQIVNKHAPEINVAGKSATRAARKEQTRKKRTRMCQVCGNPFASPFKNQMTCGRKCGYVGLCMDEQKHRDAIFARVSGKTWDWIGREIYGSKSRQSGPIAFVALRRWASRTGYDISYLKGLRAHG